MPRQALGIAIGLSQAVPALSLRPGQPLGSNGLRSQQILDPDRQLSHAQAVAWWMAEVRYYGQYVAVADVASAFFNCPTRRLIPIFGFSFSAFS
jgi:hypothetical protein